MKHKHYECIVAWAEGKDIQSWSTTRNDWIDFTHRTMIDWNFEPAKYRIKPEPKLDIIQERCIASWTGISTNLCPNIRVVFDGETGVLKSAEVI